MTAPRHLLVTNDFAPKVGGIQSYLWELWQRLDPASYAVLTASSDPAAAGFDALQAERGIEIHRVPRSILFFPAPRNRKLIERTALDVGAELIVFDPAFPLGSLARKLALPSVQLLHGAEVAIPGRLPLSAMMLRRALSASVGAIAAGPYPEAEARRVARAVGDGDRHALCSEATCIGSTQPCTRAGHDRRFA